MKTNAFTRNHVRLYRVWGDDENPPYVDLPDGSHVFVMWSPHLKQWIASITLLDYRYDAIVSTENFVLDASLLPVEAEPDGPAYYLARVRPNTL